MFYRFFGRIFVYFFVMPSVAHFTRKIFIPSIKKVMLERLEGLEKQNVKNLAKSRMNHPAGTKLDV